MPSSSSLIAPLVPADAAAVDTAPMALSLQILRFKANAMRLREEIEATDSDDDGNDDFRSLASRSGGGFERRLRRRVSSADDECACGRGGFRALASPENGGDDDEFRSADGGFKLPLLLHPVLERQQAVLRLKREAPPMTRPRPAPRAPSPSRVLPCVVARAVALRFVQ